MTCVCKHQELQDGEFERERVRLLDPACPEVQAKPERVGRGRREDERTSASQQKRRRRVGRQHGL